MVPPLHRIRPELLEEVSSYVKSFDPSTIKVDFPEPNDALYRMPTRVLVDLDGSGCRPCFFKHFSGGMTQTLVRELEGHLRLLQSGLKPDARAVRLLGIVKVDDEVGGVLLTYVDHDDWSGLLRYRAMEAPLCIRERWANQVRETVAELHEAGVVWGDAKVDNVMVDRNDNVWIIDFGGGYTEGWVDKDKAGTTDGDLQGVDRIVDYLRNYKLEDC
ncbi:hypothetical protein VTK73DRAFT_7591 [Phialemonium thermophilum]|uniref:Protein kinase domain-containing protein n=1 Tax=Phialemonium thermophilum TaxID=223376 RepID=A0ABR3WDB1_9PEZI